MKTLYGELPSSLDSKGSRGQRGAFLCGPVFCGVNVRFFGAVALTLGMAVRASVVKVDDNQDDDDYRNDNDNYAADDEVVGTDGDGDGRFDGCGCPLAAEEGAVLDLTHLCWPNLRRRDVEPFSSTAIAKCSPSPAP